VIFFWGAYFTYGKWQFWLFLVVWLLIVPNIFYKLLKKFVEKNVIFVIFDFVKKKS
jgi:hypothetical protein